MRRLSPTQRADLAGISLPADRPDDTAIVSAPGGWSVAWVRDGGRRKEAVGPAFINPIEAAAASAFLRELHGFRS